MNFRNFYYDATRFRNESRLYCIEGQSRVLDGRGVEHGFGRVLFSFYITVHNTPPYAQGETTRWLTLASLNAVPVCPRTGKLDPATYEREVRRGTWSIHAHSLPPRGERAALEK